MSESEASDIHVPEATAGHTAATDGHTAATDGGHWRTRAGDRLRQIAVVLTLVAVLAVNTLAAWLPLFGVSTAQVSDDNPTRFTPAGWTFAVWSVIYLGLIGYAAYQALPDQAANPRQRRIGWLFVVNGAANVGWLLAWHSLRIVEGVGIMVVILVTLCLIYRALERDRPPASSIERWLVDVPFSLYLAWITIATIANVAIALTVVGWSGWGLSDETWAALLIVAGGGLAAFVAFTRHDLAWAAVVVWALFGIMSGQADAPVVVATARALVGAIVFGLVAGSIASIGARPSEDAQARA